VATERQPKYTILQCYHAVSRRINREHMGGWYRFQRPDYTRSVFMRDLVGLMYRKLHGF
jgi:hypothetical protein